MDARIKNVEESLRQITQALTNVGLIPTDRPTAYTNLHFTPRNQEDRTLRIDIAKFDGLSQDPEVYIEWKSSLDRYFEFKETPLDRQYKLSKIKLTRLAAIWLEGLQKQRRREDKPRIDNWEKLKKYLRKKMSLQTLGNNYTCNGITLLKEIRLWLNMCKSGRDFLCYVMLMRLRK